jgi:hypothetical protein
MWYLACVASWLYNHDLIANHMSITAAFWSNGPNWPSGGEIDITEGVHDYTTNQFTIHTDPGCKLTSSVSSELGMAGTLIGGPDCAVASTSNQGCGIRASDNKSFGAAYNANGGGVYVMRWDAAGVAIWFFQPDKVPADLTADAPRPETWQKPEAIWAATNCDPKKYFYDHHAIFDTTLWYVSFLHHLIDVLMLSLQWRLGRRCMEFRRYSWSRTELCSAHRCPHLCGLHQEQRRCNGRGLSVPFLTDSCHVINH